MTPESGGGGGTPTDPDPGPPAATPTGRAAQIATILAVLCGIAVAWRRAWTCDDAFISFRYADDLAHGLGLVFNPGERVEGYSNFLWTLWCSLGIRLGRDPERWSIASGIAAYGVCLALLGTQTLGLRRRFGAAATALPAAALLGAVHPDWTIFASGGLETSLFTLLILCGYVLLVEGHGAPAAALAGLALAAGSLTRPDGLVFAGVAGLFLLRARRPALRPALVFALAFAAVYAPFLAWRLAYYGDWFPNPWYAKSIGRAWYGQGGTYVGLYFARYWALLAAAPLVLATAVSLRRSPSIAMNLRREWSDRSGLAAGFAVVATLAVARIGGDFMFARFLIPATPFYLILFELGLYRWRPRGRWTEVLLVPAAAAAIVLTPPPMRGGERVAGISNEWEAYSPQFCARVRRQGEALRRYFDRLPIRVVFMGAQARMIYYARPWVAIEGETGLTDRTIARQNLPKRGRVSARGSLPRLPAPPRRLHRAHGPGERRAGPGGLPEPPALLLRSSPGRATGAGLPVPPGESPMTWPRPGARASLHHKLPIALPRPASNPSGPPAR